MSLRSGHAFAFFCFLPAKFRTKYKNTLASSVFLRHLVKVWRVQSATWVISVQAQDISICAFVAKPTYDLTVDHDDWNVWYKHPKCFL